MSELEEYKGRIDNAIRETELAIGLLEMHGADKTIIQFYSDRVQKLRAALMVNNTVQDKQ